MEKLYDVFLTAVIVVLGLCCFFCLIRAIIGPRISDRIVAVNMMGTMVMVIIAILELMLQEGYLADICLIYAMISFLAVVVLVKIYMGVHREKEEKNLSREEQEELAAIKKE